MLVTQGSQLLELTAGGRVVVQGRYEPAHVDMRPPGEEPVTVVLVLSDGMRVLLGEYQSDECVRPAEERTRLAGTMVKVAGEYHPTAPYPHSGPPPAMWTGGGPQIHNVAFE